MIAPRPTTAPSSVTTAISPNSARPAAGAALATTVPEIVAEAPFASVTNPAGTFTEPSAGEKNTSR